MKSNRLLAERIGDASIAAQVRASQMSPRSTRALGTTVETTDGIVTVSGVARNPAETSRVTKWVGDVNSVSSVINNLTAAFPVVGDWSVPPPDPGQYHAIPSY